MVLSLRRLHLLTISNLAVLLVVVYGAMVCKVMHHNSCKLMVFFCVPQRIDPS